MVITINVTINRNFNINSLVCVNSCRMSLPLTIGLLLFPHYDTIWPVTAGTAAELHVLKH